MSILYISFQYHISTWSSCSGGDGVLTKYHLEKNIMNEEEMRKTTLENRSHIANQASFSFTNTKC